MRTSCCCCIIDAALLTQQPGAAALQASAHILLLLLALALEGYLRLQHRRRQAAGYLAFYWRTRGLLSNPMRITALGQVPAIPCAQHHQGNS